MECGSHEDRLQPFGLRAAARFTGRSPWEVSRDPDLMFAGHRDAYLAYRHTPIVVGIDIYNLEAEAYGARSKFRARKASPQSTNRSSPASTMPWRFHRSIPSATAASPWRSKWGSGSSATSPAPTCGFPWRAPSRSHSTCAALAGFVEDAALRPGDVARWLMRLAENQTVFTRAIAAAGLDVAFFESAAAPPLLSPRQFHTLEMPALKRILELTSSVVGHPVPCIMGGNTFLILDDILATGTGYVVCNVETDQRRFVDKLCGTHPHVNVRINMDPRIVACDNPATIHVEVDRILDIAAGRPNCLMGTGCLPLETPPENIGLIREYIA